jgi:hypothetical protein
MGTPFKHGLIKVLKWRFLVILFLIYINTNWISTKNYIKFDNIDEYSKELIMFQFILFLAININKFNIM